MGESSDAFVDFVTGKPFAPPLEARFREVRLAALARTNATTYLPVAVLVLAFAWWDRFVDPLNWRTAFVIRGLGALVILATGIVQHLSGRASWAAWIARVRYAASVLAISGALAVLDRGYLVGISGLVAMMLAGPYIAIDRRDLLVLNAVPLPGLALIMYLSSVDRFAVVNAVVFMAMAMAVSLLLARVFEASNRRAFALEQQLTREARTDALTGLLNRRALEEIAHVELKRSARAGSPLSVILCDIDRFKQVNDSHGHDVGDRVLRAIAERLRALMRETDAIGRWGGEEFLAILPGTDERAAAQLAERLRAAVESTPMPTEKEVHATVSLGVAQLLGRSSAEADPWTEVVKSADDAMYRAKAAGRNRVVADARA